MALVNSRRFSRLACDQRQHHGLIMRAGWMNVYLQVDFACGMVAPGDPGIVSSNLYVYGYARKDYGVAYIFVLVCLFLPGL